MTNNDKKGLIVLISIIAVIIAVLVVSVTISARKDGNGYGSVTNAVISENQENPQSGKRASHGRKFIAAVYLEGAIEESNSLYDQAWLLDTIHGLKENKNNAAIALYIDSPGGSVYHADEVYLALQDYKTTGRPVYVYQGPMSASGGYYISCAANRIFANRNTLTGCIGVIFGSSFDVTELLKNIGIKSQTFHSGRNKTMLSPDEPLTEEQKEIMQELCDECYRQFVSIVANNRDMSYKEAEALSDGRLYSARQALENGLIDSIDSWDNMITILSEDELGMPGIKVASFRKEKERNIMDMVMSSVTKLQNQEAAAKLGIPSKVLEDLTGFDTYPAYLYRGF